jgi:branched-chain amino acid transport system permease protein
MQVIQLLLSGIAQGMIFSLVAFGYNITFSTSKTLNFALGNVLMAGGVVGFIIYMTNDLPFVAAILGVMLLGAFLGLVVKNVAVDPSLKTNSQYGWILGTLAVGIVLKNVVEVFWSTDDFKFRSPLGEDVLRFGEIAIYPQELLIIAVSLIIVAAVETFKHKTIFGRAIVAVSEDKETASLMGINQRFVVIFSFMLSAGIACIAGVLVAPITLVSATMGTVLGVKAYAVSIIGGLESGYGVILGGLIIGITEALTARYVSTGYKEIPGFIILILILLFKPSGIFGKKIIKKV